MPLFKPRHIKSPIFVILRFLRCVFFRVEEKKGNLVAYDNSFVTAVAKHNCLASKEKSLYIIIYNVHINVHIYIHHVKTRQKNRRGPASYSCIASLEALTLAWSNPKFCNFPTFATFISQLSDSQLETLKVKEKNMFEEVQT